MFHLTTGMICGLIQETKGLRPLLMSHKEELGVAGDVEEVMIVESEPCGF